MRYDRKSIQKDMWMQLDGPGQVIVKRSEPPRFGQPSADLDAIKRKLEAARRRLQEIAAEVAAAKRQ